MISAVVGVSMSVQGHQLASSGKWQKKKKRQNPFYGIRWNISDG